MKAADSGDLTERILQLVRGPKARPMARAEIARKLRLSDAQAESLEQLLPELEQQGRVARVRHNRYVAPEVADLVVGVFHCNAKGFGHVISEQEGQGDLFIPAENTGTALHLDRVVARISREGRPGRGRGAAGDARGHVIRILSRARTELVGTLTRSKAFFYVVPDDPRLVHGIYVNLSADRDRKAEPGDKVVVRLFEWTQRHEAPEGEIVEVLGRAGDPGVDMLAILRNHGIRTRFSEETLKEAESVNDAIDLSSMPGREDFRNVHVITIDPDDARDFDDAIHVERTDKGWILQVHIADVSHYVRPGSALDKEARERGNSVYLPDRVIPMLPERLSNGVCSLRPDEDRLVFTAIMEFDREGRRRRERFTRGVIRSRQRLTYKQAFAILNKPPKTETERRIHVAWELASLLRTNRFKNGSLELDFPEVKVWVNRETGKTERVERVENDISHQLIEECMLAANEAVAHRLKNRGVPAVYRIHEDPDPDKLREYREVVQSHGYRVGDLSKREEVRKLLRQLEGKPEEQALKIGFLKSLQRARYETSPLGHYGLAKSDYAHFTSPIRRYADLLVHRSLAFLLGGSGKVHMGVGALREVALHISNTEREAADAEREAVKLKLLEYFLEQAKSNKRSVFPGVILEVRNYGLFVDLPDFMINGLVHVSSLEDDFYRFEPSQGRLVGSRRRRVFRAGQKVALEVDRVDLLKKQVDFRIVENRNGRTVRPGRKSN
jgi:ribonuclease R